MPSGGARVAVAILIQFLKDAHLFTEDELHDVLTAFGTSDFANNQS